MALKELSYEARKEGAVYKKTLKNYILTWVGAYKDFYASGGARGVGLATTQSVVMGSILLLMANYFLTAALF